MKKRKTLLLSRKDIETIIDIKRAVAAVEKAFSLYEQGKAQMPPKIYLDLKRYNGDFRAMPAYLSSMEAVSLKWVNVHPNNKGKGLPTVMAVVILSDPRTGFPLSVMDGTHITNLRTGAAGGVAAKYLARKDAQSLGLIGCGEQARTQLLAIKELFSIKKVYVWGHQQSLVRAFIREMKNNDYQLQAVKTIREAAQDSDIIVTTTPSRKPLVKERWLKKGVHINAIGADAKGKQELQPSILKSAKLVIDDWAQASHSGEINKALSKKIITKKHVHAQIGQVVNKKRKGRTSGDNITVFDSTGLAIQDTAVAQLVYRSAKRKKKGRYIDFLG